MASRAGDPCSAPGPQTRRPGGLGGSHWRPRSHHGHGPRGLLLVRHASGQVAAPHALHLRGLPSDPLSWALAPTHGAPSPLFCLTLAGGAASIGRGEDVGAGVTEGPGFAAAQRQGAVTWPLPLLGWLPALAARAPPRALCGPCSRFNSIPPRVTSAQKLRMCLVWKEGLCRHTGEAT